MIFREFCFVVKTDNEVFIKIKYKSVKCIEKLTIVILYLSNKVKTNNEKVNE